MKRLLAISSLSFIVLTGCSEGASNKAMDPESIYDRGCLACHGGNLEGGSFGPPVTGMAAKYSEEQVLDMINNGVGKMRGNLVSPEEAEIVTKWLMEK